MGKDTAHPAPPVTGLEIFQSPHPPQPQTLPPRHPPTLVETLPATDPPTWQRCCPFLVETVSLPWPCFSGQRRGLRNKTPSIPVPDSWVGTSFPEEMLLFPPTSVPLQVGLSNPKMSQCWAQGALPQRDDSPARHSHSNRELPSGSQVGRREENRRNLILALPTLHAARGSVHSPPAPRAPSFAKL